jgi:hypothetical protein
MPNVYKVSAVKLNNAFMQLPSKERYKRKTKFKKIVALPSLSQLSLGPPEKIALLCSCQLN